ncbi:MAG TPA: asparagine synthase (glutamine-hydrolyzing) [Phycisphaerae bacterium]|nr:asparagine synthase (glutamine-hydrolyzing) [Phycisphaerae bacterium]
MCGIAGYILPSGLLDAAILNQMLARIRHRGPDGDGTWTSPAEGLAFGHTRLKVQDLTPAADQPMHSPDGRFSLVYNGEIYNFPELRDELRAAGATFRSTGDTEVLLELCRRQPDLAFLPRLNGMFAFALWDATTKTLSLVRDRTGVKPLLYAETRGGLAFASEMAALRPVLTDEFIDPTAVMQLLTLGFIAAPRTIFTQVRKLRPGHLLRFKNGESEIKKWAPAPPFETDITNFEEACRRLRETFSDAVRARLIADVPVGVFLSGGIDSAIVTAMACKNATGRVRTFSVGFPGQPFFDETAYAKAVADMHGTDHTVLPLSLDEIRDIIPTVQAHLGEPFADSSALPTYLLSRLTRQHVTVALSGDGADELFAGYNRYAAATLTERFGWFARTPLYAPTRALLERLPAKRERKLGAIVSQMKRAIRSMDSDLLCRYANWMRTSDDRTLARLLSDPAQAPAVIQDIVQLLWNYRGEPKDTNDLNCHLRTEWQLSLPDDMLTKIDLMSMAHGLEVRSPFLDYRVVDQVFPMPWRWKLCGWKKKHLLVEAFKDDLPPILHNRSKKGFEVPVGVWLRGPLYGMARDLIANDRCFFGQLLSREGAQKTLDDHAAGRADHNFCLWALVSLLAWQQQHAPNAAL